MKPLYQNMLRKSQIVLTIALGTLPVPLVLFANVAENLLPYAWVFPVAYMVLTMISMAVPGKLRIAYGVVGMLVLLIPSVLVPSKPLGVREVVFWVGVFYGIILMLSLQIAGWEKDRELPVSCMGYCLVPHLIGQFLVMFDAVRGEVLGRIGPWMTAALLAFVGLVMLAMNRKSVAEVTGKRKSTAAAIRGKNTLLTLALFAIALLAALLPSALGALVGVSEWISGWLNKLIALLFAHAELPPPSETTTVPTEPSEGLPLVPPKEGNAQVAQITFIVIVVIAVAVLIPLVFYALNRIIKALQRGFRVLWKWLMEMSANASEESYEDEITDTRDSEEWKQMRRERRQRRQNVFADERKMTPTQRIRHRYQRLAKKHPEWRAGSTARENLPGQAAALYERARYSSHPVNEDDALQFKTETKRI